MDPYLNDDEHHEDDLPPAPYPPLIRRINNDAYETEQPESDRSNRLLENWRNLYETSVQSLQSNDNYQSSFFINRQVTNEKPPSTMARVFPTAERPYSPIYQPQLETNESKSKWQIRLPTLLNSVVGPDRQTRNLLRRHTTNIVFQQRSSDNAEVYSAYPSQTSNGTNVDESITPLVKQLKLKFDRMISQGSSTAPPRLHRTASLTSRGLQGNSNVRLIEKPRSAVPNRPAASTAGVNSSLDLRTLTTKNRGERGRTGPPISYSRHYYPPPSAKSVVKQLLDGGATLVYDSGSQQIAAKGKPLVVKREKTFEQTRKALQDTDSAMTGRQILPKSSDDGYAKVQRKGAVNERKADEENIYEPISYRSSVGSSERKSNSLRHSAADDASDQYVEAEGDPTANSTASAVTERANQPISADNHEDYYPVYDASQWR